MLFRFAAGGAGLKPSRKLQVFAGLLWEPAGISVTIRRVVQSRSYMEIYQMNITVYLGSAAGNDPKYVKEVIRLGTWIGASGHRLIYGGSRIGLMGELAEAVLQAGGEVIGIEPGFFVSSCLQHEGITELIVTETMAERKAKLIEYGDAYIAFPGGTGTLEEISEVMSQIRLGHNESPCLILNLDGYYEPLRQMLDTMVRNGFLDQESRNRFLFVPDTEGIAEALQDWTA